MKIANIFQAKLRKHNLPNTKETRNMTYSWSVVVNFELCFCFYV